MDIDQIDELQTKLTKGTKNNITYRNKYPNQEN